jgi:type I restriction enzyme S subunit
MKYPAYPHYKDSGIAWLGEVPEGWQMKAIKWESLVQRGASPRPIDDPVYFDDDGEYAWVRISDVTAAGMYLEVTEQKLSELGASLSVKLEPGALFLSIAGTVGKPCIARIKCCIHDGFVYFPRWKGDFRYLFYIFASGEPYKGLGKMGTQLNLNTDTVGSIVIGLPTHDEQTAIADFLDRETGRIDTLVAKKRKLVELLKEKRSVLISRTVTRGLPADAAREFGLEAHTNLKSSGFEWLGQVPEGWEVLPLKLAIKFIEGPGIMASDFTEDGIPLLRISSIGKKLATLDGCNYVSHDLGTTKWSHFRVKKHDLLISGSASTGLCSEVDELTVGSIPYTGIIIIRPYPKTDRGFARWFFLSKLFYDQSNLAKTGSTIQHFGPTHLSRMVIVFPPKDEQTAIATYLDRETAKIDRLVEKVEIAMARLQEFRSALITAAVTGKIDVREHI